MDEKISIDNSSTEADVDTAPKPEERGTTTDCDRSKKPSLETKIDWLKVDTTAYEHYSKMYFFSLDLRERLASRAQAPLTAILALLGAQSYFFLNELFKKQGLTLVVLLLLVIAAFIFACVTSVLLFKVLSGTKYEVMPTAEAIEKYRAECLNSYASQAESSEWHEHWAGTTIRAEIARNLSLCADHNGRMNDRRSEYSWHAHRFLLISVALTLLVFIVGYLSALYSAWDGNQKSRAIFSAKTITIDSIANRGKNYFLADFLLKGDQHEQYKQQSTEDTAATTATTD